MPFYRKKPVVIDAFQLGFDPEPKWYTDAERTGDVVTYSNTGEFGIADNADIKTLEGWFKARRGNFIIQGVKGEIYACDEEIFHMTYEKLIPGPEPVTPSNSNVVQFNRKAA